MEQHVQILISLVEPCVNRTTNCMGPEHRRQINRNQPAQTNTAWRSLYWIECLSVLIMVLCALEVRCGFSVFAGEQSAGRTASDVPRGYWSFSWVAEDDLSFPNDTLPTSGESDVVISPQTDGQAKVPLSSKKILCSQLAVTRSISSPSARINVSFPSGLWHVRWSHG